MELEDFYASIPDLRAHQAVLKQEIMMSEELLREIRRLDGQDGFVTNDRYRQLVRRVQRLYDFFQEMHRFMENACDALEEASESSGKSLREAADSSLPHLYVPLD